MSSVRHQTHKPAADRAPAMLLTRTGHNLAYAREKVGLAALAVERARRGTLARLRRSRLLRWRHRAPVADDLLLAPPDLRPQDPSFVDELETGGFGLCGLTVSLRGASPFAVHPPNAVWARELHGFGWLRHFGAAWNLENEQTARRLVEMWIAGRRRHSNAAWAPEVVGRRMISWLSHAALILNSADRRSYAAVLLSLEDQATYLSATWRNAPYGHPRLVALTGLVQSSLCIAGHERRLGPAERALLDELENQILPDGGHVTRNPWIGVDLLLDLLPLKQCFIARGLRPNATLLQAIDRMLAMLQHLRLGDGQLPRFNGTGATERDALATVLAYDKGAEPTIGPISPSRYVRLRRGATTVLVDAGTPPAVEVAGHACAGCLSFEMSVGDELLIVNCGTPGAAHERNAATARSTASHSTLVLNGQSSSKLLRGELLQREAGGAPIQQPNLVTCEVQEAGGNAVLKASHDGYADRFKLLHTRTLSLDATGQLRGIDKLHGTTGDVRFARDVPFAVHFHLHPRAGARLAPDGSADIALPSGQHWRLSVSGAALTIEESTHFADVIGPVQTQQVVLRAACCGIAEVQWILEYAGRPGAPAETADSPGASEQAEQSSSPAAVDTGNGDA